MAHGELRYRDRDDEEVEAQKRCAYKLQREDAGEKEVEQCQHLGSWRGREWG